jgi:radical SAM superfamily enzyme YgiQ (UPF0313 family)
MKYSKKSERELLLGRETILERFPRAPKSAIRAVAVYPAPYRVGMSNLGFHFLFGSLSRSGALRVERAFRDTTPFTLESGSELSRFDLLFFSISYEEDYINLVRMLYESGVEIWREKREGSPLIVAGGAAVSGNPFPLVDIVDIFCIGEGEGPVDFLNAAIAGSGREGIDTLPERLAGVKGIFVPGRKASFAERSAPERFSRSLILSPATVFPDTMLFESSRGCPGRCSFCLARSLYHPFRPIPASTIEGYLEASDSRIDRVGMVSTAVAAHPEFVELVDSLIGRGISVSYSSMRAEDIDERSVGAIGRSGVRSVSLAPESGSEGERFALGKRVPDEAYMRAGALLAAEGVKKFSLYILVGAAPGRERVNEETEIFLRRFREAVGEGRISVHLNPLIPKPWTPMQYFAMPRADLLERSIEALSALCKRLGLGAQSKSIRSAIRQAILSTGDAKVGRAIARMVTTGTSWKKALERERVDTEFPHVAKTGATRFPWDAIEGPVRRENLIGLYEGIAERDMVD